MWLFIAPISGFLSQTHTVFSFSVSPLISPETGCTSTLLAVEMKLVLHVEMWEQHDSSHLYRCTRLSAVWTRFHKLSCFIITIADVLETRQVDQVLFQLSVIYICAFSRCFYPKRLTVHSGYTFIVSMCSLIIEPTTFYAANTMLYHWATGAFMLCSVMIIESKYPPSKLPLFWWETDSLSKPTDPVSRNWQVFKKWSSHDLHT